MLRFMGSQRVGHNGTTEPNRTELNSPLWGFLGGSAVKNLATMQETRFRSLRQGDPLEEGTATSSRILAYRTPRAEETGGLQKEG